ncbi:MAG: hypothetical protein KAI17_02950 [Thiotrichaceae bacterium]|nr:hypothetical protein [Thiotrichaceae bacterium]
MKITTCFFCSLLFVTNCFADTTPQAPSQATLKAQKKAALIKQGENLHQAYCAGRCHGNWIYTRATSRIRNYAALTVHVQSCATNLRKFLRKRWTNPEIAAVAAYLNDEYYLFKRK